MLKPDEVFRLIGPIDVEPVRQMLDRLEFLHVNEGRKGKYPQDVVLRQSFPPELDDFVLRLGLGGRTARAILRKLPPRVSIPPHVDEWMPSEMNWRRFQVPITSDPAIRMRWPDDGVELYLEPGNIYEVRYDRTHEVVNEADVERVHLQVDQVDATV